MKKLKYPESARMSDNGAILVIKGKTKVVTYLNSAWILKALEIAGVNSTVIQNQIIDALEEYSVIDNERS